jgi:hypothetical protein
VSTTGSFTLPRARAKLVVKRAVKVKATRKADRTSNISSFLASVL